MSAISGTRRSMREMADGTIRVSIDIDPVHRTAFFEMFGSIDMPVALAPLVADFERKEEKPKGGNLSQDAARICQDERFQKFLGLNNEAEAAHYVREFCEIKSRALLDHSADAALRFKSLMRGYSQWIDRKVA